MKASVERAPSRQALLEDCRALYARAAPNFYISPAWIGTWLDAAAPAAKLYRVTVADDSGAIAALGIFGVSDRRGFAAPRQARLHETGVARIDKLYIEYNDLLVANDAPQRVREAAIEEIVNAVPDAAEFVFRNSVRPLVEAVMHAGALSGLQIRRIRREPTFQIQLADSTSGDVLSHFSASLRAKIKRAIRRYEERGPLHFERADDAADRDALWTELIRLHNETWSRRGEKGAFASPQFARFHRALAQTHPEKVDLVRVAAGNETIGCLLNFIEGGRVSNYQSGFRYEVDNQLAPGFVCHALAANDYRAKGMKVYDLMAGEADYKRRLGTEGETLETVTLTRPSARARFRAMLGALRSGSREMRRT